MNIDYEGITFDLFEYLEDVSIFAISGENLTRQSCIDAKNCTFFNLKNNYNGFDQMKSFFVRCFGVEINRNYSEEVQGIFVTFKKTLKNILKQIEYASLTF